MPPKSPPKEKADAGTEKKVLVGVRVPEKFHQRIQSECLRRDMTLQEMVVAALKLYFRSPADWDYMSATYVKHGEAGEELPDEEVARRNAWLDLWTRYVNRMPEDKVTVFTHAMEWDLQAQKSSRRKSVRDPAPSK